ncbi:hypothetical protein GGR51DRAFT_560904 [Nemania sp. FL0031]|nr:hypothetical protein GGR51DRAFT_560904 [Nemania sp. FL0031]
MGSTAGALRGQWANPSDILSLLLVIGGNIVQKAIAQLMGCTIHLPGCTDRHVSIAPVVFLFGWVSYAFLSLQSVVSGMRRMPTSDCPSLTGNCANGFARKTNSWILGISVALTGPRECISDDPAAEVNLDEEGVLELEDVEEWATKRPVTPIENTGPGQTPLMLRWLDTMTVENGLPAWLEPIKPDIK